MQKIELSVAIITHNEEVFLAKALESVSFAGDIIVVDSFSTDTTVNIAKSYTDKVYSRPFDDFSSQRNFSLEHALYDWILVIDADETIPPELRDEIINIVRNSPKADTAYSIGRSNIFMDRILRHGGLSRDRVIRLFPKSTRYTNRVHEVPDTGELPVKRLKHKIMHETYKGYGVMMSKTYKYSTLKAKDMYEAGYKPSLFKMMIKPAFRFTKQYIFRGGFLDGKQGFIFAYINALEVFQRVSKIWRMKHGENLIAEKEI